MAPHAVHLASRLSPVATGIATGVLLWALIFVVQTLTQALIEAGFPANWAGLAILGLFIGGGLEGALFLATAFRTWRWSHTNKNSNANRD